jgi:hypothetical protein
MLHSLFSPDMANIYRGGMGIGCQGELFDNQQLPNIWDDK